MTQVRAKLCEGVAYLWGIDGERTLKIMQMKPEMYSTDVNCTIGRANLVFQAHTGSNVNQVRYAIEGLLKYGVSSI